jgi:hypothetical protein
MSRATSGTVDKPHLVAARFCIDSMSEASWANGIFHAARERDTCQGVVTATFVARESIEGSNFLLDNCGHHVYLTGRHHVS